MLTSSRLIPTRLLVIPLVIAFSCTLFAQSGDPVTPPPGKAVPIDQAPNLFSPPSPPPPGYASTVRWLNEWLLAYARLEPKRRAWLTPATVVLADMRQSLMRELIRRDPATSLALKLSPDQRLGLPAVIVARLERLVDGRGEFRVDMGELLPAVSPSPNGPPVKTPLPGAAGTTLTRSVQVGQTRYSAHVFGRRQAQQSKVGLPIHGIAIGADLALGEDPFRLLDTVEIIQRGFQPGSIVAISGDHVIPGLSDLTLKKLLQDLLGREGLLGPHVRLPWDSDPVDPPPVGCGTVPPAGPGWTLGLKRVLVIRADFEDLPGKPIHAATHTPMTDEFIMASVADGSSLFEQNSQGRTCLEATIVPDVLRMPRTAASYAAESPFVGPVVSTVREAAVAAAQDYDLSHGGAGLFDPDAYDRTVVVFGPIVGVPAAATAGIGGSRAGFHAAFSGAFLLHELGHTYGFTHSSYWLPSEVSYDSPEYENPLRDGTLDDGGDLWDPMGLGAGAGARAHVNAFFKQYALWIDASDWTNITETGVYRVYAHDGPRAAGQRVLRIDADAAKTYWLDVRRNFPEDLNLSTGLEVRYESKPPDPAWMYQGVVLLDMTPTTQDRWDHALTYGRSFFDRANGIRITVWYVGTDITGPYVDVQVELGVM